MARGRPRGQRNALERLMPRADYEALEARRQARCDRGDDSDDSTVPNDDDDDNDAIQIGQGDPADPDLDEEADAGAIEDTIDAIIRRSTTSMFQRILMFNQGAAESLYDDQMITTIEIL
jgi:hypothetical protein